MNVEDAMKALRAGLQAPPEDPKFEGLLAGSPTTKVNRVGTCFAPSIEVLRAAAAAGCNLLLSDAHPFFLYDAGYGARLPNVQASEGAAAVAAKKRIIEENGMAVVRIRTAWERSHPAAASRAYAASLGWPTAAPAQGWAVQALPAPMTLDAFLSSFGSKNGLAGVRVIGSGDTQVSKVAIFSGLATPAHLRAMLSDPSIDLILTGEVNEWEGGPYIEDAITAGRRIALVLTGFAVSREPMAQAMADWARGVLPGLTVQPFTSKPAIWSA
jgi:putative NIF3 family GTP cyclohydrolase 1 type 2